MSHDISSGANILGCRRCIYDASVPGITFNADGVCSYCELHDRLDAAYPNRGDAGKQKLDQMLNEMKRAGRGRKYDCVVGVSGGCDSSYLLHILVENGLRPLAVHFDNTWNSPIATQNIHRVVEKLNLDLHTLVANNKEYDDIYRSFLLAGVIDVEAPTDIGFIATLYLAAEKHGLKYVVEGHSFRTEGVSPLGWMYMDGKYIQSVHRRFGRVPMRTYPNMTLTRFLRWSAIRGIKRVRPLYHVDYDKAAAKALLAERYGWEWYGGHHLENRFTAFYHSYLMPRRFGADQRANNLAALVRSGQMQRDAALEELASPPYLEDNILALVKKRLELSEADFEHIMTQPIRTWHEFETYKRTFELLRPLFRILVKAGRVPESFYLKFCFKADQLGKL